VPGAGKFKIENIRKQVAYGYPLETGDSTKAMVLNAEIESKPSQSFDNKDSIS